MYVKIKEEIEQEKELTRTWKLVKDSVKKSGNIKLVSLSIPNLPIGGRTFGWKKLFGMIDEAGINSGQKHAEAVLNRREGIPKEWEKYKIFFMGTEWLADWDYFGDLEIVWPYLYFYKRAGVWKLSFADKERLKDVENKNSKLAVLE